MQEHTTRFRAIVPVVVAILLSAGGACPTAAATRTYPAIACWGPTVDPYGNGRPMPYSSAAGTLFVEDEANPDSRTTVRCPIMKDNPGFGLRSVVVTVIDRNPAQDFECTVTRTIPTASGYQVFSSDAKASSGASDQAQRILFGMRSNKNASASWILECKLPNSPPYDSELVSYAVEEE